MLISLEGTVFLTVQNCKWNNTLENKNIQNAFSQNYFPFL